MPGVKESSIPCTIMRGGTSKALFFLDSDLPADAHQRTECLLRAFGSPDIRQVDGERDRRRDSARFELLPPRRRRGQPPGALHVFEERRDAA